MLVAGMMAVAPFAGAGDKTDVCHSEGNGSFHMIHISVNAFDKHLAHGDAAPGDLVPGTTDSVFDDDCTIVSARANVYTSGGATAETPWGNVTLTFDVWDSPVAGSMTWVRAAPNANTWGGPVVAATIGTSTASFVVRPDTGAAALQGCEVTVAVTAGGSGVGTWDIAAVHDITAGSCDAAGQIQGPYTIFSGEIVIDS
jgi:hypothetical protein